MLRNGVFLSLALLITSPGWTTTVVGMDLDELTQRSDRILVGTAQSIRYEMHPTAGYPITKTTFRIEESLYGEKSGNEVTVSVIGGPAGNGLVTVVPGMPRFQIHDKAVLFLVQDEKTGTSIPTGLEQGVFRIKVDPETEKEYIVNQSVDLGVDLKTPADNKAFTKHLAERVRLADFKRLLKNKIKELKKPLK